MTSELDRVRALFVSPHLDDVALSCGGTVARHVDAGDAPMIVTVFAGLPGPYAVSDAVAAFHALFGFAPTDGDGLVVQRRREDQAATDALGAALQWLSFPDAVYRSSVAARIADVFRPLTSADRDLMAAVAGAIERIWRATAHAVVYLPLGVGGHVDHRICAGLARPLADAGARVRLYEELPYVLTQGALETALDGLDGRAASEPVDVTRVFERRLAAMACYTSQLPFLFRVRRASHRLTAYRAMTRRYAASLADGGLWERFWSLG